MFTWDCDHKHRTLTGALECGLTDAQISAGNHNGTILVSDDGGQTFTELSARERYIRRNYESLLRQHRGNDRRAEQWRSIFGDSDDPRKDTVPSKGPWAPVAHPGEWDAYLKAHA